MVFIYGLLHSRQTFNEQKYNKIDYDVWKNRTVWYVYIIYALSCNAGCNSDISPYILTANWNVLSINRYTYNLPYEVHTAV